jgi:RHS repeat-associated protein
VLKPMKTHLTLRAAVPALALVGWLLLPQTGLCFYNPTTGRWLSRDPMIEAGCRTLARQGRLNGVLEQNSYAFVANDPLRKWDLLGMIGEGGVWPPPSNEVNPPPTGPFKKCKIALMCHGVNFPHTPIPTGQQHCGLVIDLGDGVYDLNGGGGTENRRNLTPGSASDASGPWTDNDPSVCECLFANIKSWNDKHVPRDNLCANSNWNLKCMNKKCNVKLDWGTQKLPWGYNCRECVRWGTTGGSGSMPPVPCCVEHREKPCPD